MKSLARDGDSDAGGPPDGEVGGGLGEVGGRLVLMTQTL
ncbi:hypothetical protein Y717_29670 [Streptomyces scopuliridis RB72]|uniref:Uncharacterized protein n=1 Tax=Streptomyces scopuliridis RB72 TaxID=1440053 RepID=A0A2T7TC96_9ACTN|nr:hypothetical protein Y717_29670 [Streptomyces scopuliridis RB72]